jgi:hypothetical protein
LEYILLHNTFPSATVFSFDIFTLLMFRKLNKPQLIKIKQQNCIGIRYFRSGIIYVQNWRVCELLKCILAIQKQLTNRPQVITNQTDHRWTFDTWKTLKYLNFDIFTLLMFRKLNKPQLIKIKQQNCIGIRAFDSRLYLDISRSFHRRPFLVYFF